VNRKLTQGHEKKNTSRCFLFFALRGALCLCPRDEQVPAYLMMPVCVDQSLGLEGPPRYSFMKKGNQRNARLDSFRQIRLTNDPAMARIWPFHCFPAASNGEVNVVTRIRFALWAAVRNMPRQKTSPTVNSTRRTKKSVPKTYRLD